MGQPADIYLAERHLERRLSDQQALTSRDLESRRGNNSNKRAKVGLSLQAQPSLSGIRICGLDNW